MRKLLVLAGVVGLVLVPVVALADGSATSPVSGQELAWDSSVVSTTTTSWVTIPALSGLAGGCNVDGISATVTLNVTGKPFEVRVANGPHILNAPQAIFRPPASANTETFSADFVAGPNTDNTPLAVEIQWRLAASGGSATLHGGSVVVLPGDSHCG